jgi:divalent metal cation (Fe/Co/Zn/Cd) transporter
MGTPESKIKNRKSKMPDRVQLVRRATRLEYLTVGWNLLEAVVAIVSGLLAGSVALMGFGLDSVIETFSGATLLWRLGHDHDPERRERSERLALRLVGLSLLLLAVYVAADAALALLHRKQPEESLPGIVLAAVSLAVMPLLARAKRKVAQAIGSDALHADSVQTDICAWLSAILLGGLLLNALRGWWWADPIAALIMAPLIGKEGIEALRGRGCGCSCAADPS